MDDSTRTAERGWSRGHGDMGTQGSAPRRPPGSCCGTIKAFCMKKPGLFICTLFAVPLPSRDPAEEQEGPRGWDSSFAPGSAAAFWPQLG